MFNSKVDQKPYELRLVLQEFWKELRSSSFWLSSLGGHEYFFRQLLKKQGLPLLCVDDQVPRKHQLEWTGTTTFSLIAPSGTANRAIGSMQEYKTNKANDSQYAPFDFRVAQYGKVFKKLS